MAKEKTWLMIIILVALAASVGFVVNRNYILPAVLVSLTMSFVSYYFSDAMVLRISGAKQIKKEDDPKLFEVIEQISATAQLPVPKVYYINDSAPNAFATGRDPKHASICITRGLREVLNRPEMEGVLAHELSHVKNFDTRLMAFTAVLVGFISMAADWFMRGLWYRGDDDRDNQGNLLFVVIGITLGIISPIVATIIQLAISRRREFEADAGSAKITADPDALANALQKIADSKTIGKFANNATAHLFIANPFKNANWLAHFFDTHPPIEERIRLLRAM